MLLDVSWMRSKKIVSIDAGNPRQLLAELGSNGDQSAGRPSILDFLPGCLRTGTSDHKRYFGIRIYNRVGMQVEKGG